MAFCRENTEAKSRPGEVPALFDTTLTPLRLVSECLVDGRERVLHGAGGVVAHAGHDVTVSVQCDRYRGVPEQLLDELGMDPFREQ
jgi:hypothetical protein